MNLKLLLSAVVALSCGTALIGVTAVAQDRAAPTEEAGKESDAKSKWASHMGDLPFVIGYEKGMAQVELTGKPPMLFFTSDH